MSIQTYKEELPEAQLCLAEVNLRLQKAKTNKVDGWSDWSDDARRNYIKHGAPFGTEESNNTIMLETAVKEYLLRDRAPTTINTYRTELQSAIDFFGAKKFVGDIRRRDIQDYIKSRSVNCLVNVKTKNNRGGENLNRISIKKRVDRLRQLIKWCRDREEIEDVDIDSLFSGLEIPRGRESQYKRDLPDWQYPEQRMATLDKLIDTNNSGWDEGDVEDPRSWDRIYLNADHTKEIHQMMEDNAEDGWVFHRRVDLPAEAEEEIIKGDHLITEDGNYIIQYDWNKMRLWGAIVFSSFTGVRRSEIVRIKRSDIDIESDNPTVTVRRLKGRGTGEHYRLHQMPIHPTLKVFLEWYLRYKAELECVFCDNDCHYTNGEFDEKRVTHKANRLGQLSRRVMRYWKFPYVSGFHMYRHSLVSLLHEQGFPVEQIADMIGHQNVKVTGMYTHESLQKKLEQRADMLAGI